MCYNLLVPDVLVFFVVRGIIAEKQIFVAARKDDVVREVVLWLPIFLHLINSC